MIDIRRAADRRVTRTSWLESSHSFAFGQHYDPANTGFGPLVAHNDDVLAPGAGFPRHPHRDLEIVTWVIDGALAHEDDSGRRELITPGVVQRMSAAEGTWHAETNASAVAPVRYIQAWLRADPPVASYDRYDLAGQLARGGVASLPMRDSGATLRVARLAASGELRLRAAGSAHLYVATGAGALDAQQLGAGDAARLEQPGGLSFTAGEPSELLVWELPASD